MFPSTRHGVSRATSTLIKQFSNTCTANDSSVAFSVSSQKFLPSTFSATQLILNRQYSFHRISNNLEYFSADDNAIIKREPNSMSIAPSCPPPSSGRPITILLSWLMANDKHVKKFVKLYTDLGMDVLKLKTTPLDLIRPTKGSQISSGEMLEFLHQNSSIHGPILVHGFSVGAYVFCEGMVQVEKDMAKYGYLLDRFAGQIWDSPVDIEGIVPGAAAAITSNKVLRKTIQKYLSWHMKVNYNSATRHYEKSSEMMHRGFMNAPALIIMSESDVVAHPSMVAGCYQKWETNGQMVYWKCFDDSRHVSHYHKYKKEYTEEVLAFLQKVGISESKKLEMAA